MASSMNNWLGFSLSSQELPSQHPHQTHPSPAAAADAQIIAGGIDTSAHCFGLPTDPSPAALNILNLRHDDSFVLDPFNRTHPHLHQDWNMKGYDYKGSSSDLSMLVGSSCSQNAMGGEPKLENFLGGHSFADNDHQKLPPGCGAFDTNSGDYMFANCSMQLPGAAPPAMAANNNNGGGGLGGLESSNSIGLSMIKTWLRNQPAPSTQQECKIGGAADASSGGGDHGGSSSMLMSAAAGPSANAQSLSLSMSTGGGGAAGGGGGGGDSSSSVDNKQNGCGGTPVDAQSSGMEIVPRKSVDTFGQRTSIYRGVTRHRWTGRYEAHLWDNSCRREGQTRKGRQVYLGGYDKEEKAARAYDLAALKYWGTTTTTNFPVSNYEKELEEMKHMTRQEYVASLRRKSSGFSRGASIYRGVTRHHQHGRWQARIGRVAGNKDLYLGTFSTQEEAAEAYDIAAIKFRGLNAVTNFDMSRYDVKSILESSTLPIGGAAKRLKDAGDAEALAVARRPDVEDYMTSQFADYASSHHHHNTWPTIAFQQPQPLSLQYPYGQQQQQQQQQQQRGWLKQEQESSCSDLSLHGYQDLHQLQLGNNTHNFFQPSVLNNLMNLQDSTPVVVPPGSNYYSTGSTSYHGGGSNGYAMPMGTTTAVAEQSHTNQGSGSSFGENEVKQLGGYGNMMPSSDPYTDRNIYYLQHQHQQSQSHGGGVGGGEISMKAADGYDHSASYGNRMPSSVQDIGAPIFTLWNDTDLHR